jgi:hypothetical protein
MDFKEMSRLIYNFVLSTAMQNLLFYLLILLVMSKRVIRVLKNHFIYNLKQQTMTLYGHPCALARHRK